MIARFLVDSGDYEAVAGDLDAAPFETGRVAHRRRHATIDATDRAGLERVMQD